MKPIEFLGQNVIAAENQDQYLNLPALVKRDAQGEVVSCWQLSLEDLEELKNNGGKIWLSVFTFHKGLPPVVMLTTNRETALGTEYCETCKDQEGCPGVEKETTTDGESS